MKTLFTFLATAFICASVLSQSPEKMSYQAVVRNSSDVLVTNTQVGMQISILQDSEAGTPVYTETQTPTTNANGLVSIEIGGGAGFGDIDWADGPYFIKTETDPAGGTNYSIAGTSELLSVPYALYSLNGTPGPQGLAGVDGTNGIDGAKGDTGDQGIQGEIGLTGAKGDTGLTGAAGADGTNGVDGAVGDTGDQGIQGEIGLTGAKGDTGLTGAAGADGTNGVDGAVGDTGDQGIQGEIGLTGAKGDTGLTGAAGADGTNGVDGAVGDTGDQGIQGEIGLTGTSGADGLTTSVNSIPHVSGNITLTTENIPVSTDKNYVTDVQLTVIDNTSNTNTGDQTLSGLGGVASNASITGATKTKITYDAKGLVISGADATTVDITASTDKNYVTDAQLTVIGNTSGTNTGDNATNTQYNGLVTNATHTGDATGATALTVVGINGTSLAGLATGILKNTASTGVPSIAVAGTDYLTPTGSAALLTNFPLLNQNTTGNAATVTTNANLTGMVTSDGNATTVVTNANLAGDVISSGNVTTIANKVTMSGTSPVSITGSPTVIATGAVAISIAAATTSAAGSMSAADKTKLDGITTTAHTIGESYGGGIVFYVTPDGLHGLIAETQDQSISCNWYDAQDVISNPGNHSTTGKNYTDWRLPTKYELILLYQQRSGVGGFAGTYYWSSSEINYLNAYAWSFTTNNQVLSGKTSTNYVRAVRAF